MGPAGGVVVAFAVGVGEGLGDCAAAAATLNSELPTTIETTNRCNRHVVFMPNVLWAKGPTTLSESLRIADWRQYFRAAGKAPAPTSMPLARYPL